MRDRTQPKRLLAALLVFAAIAGPRLWIAAYSLPIDDELAAVDVGRLALDACIPWPAVPWDQPPLGALLGGLTWTLLGADHTFGSSWTGAITALRMTAAFGWWIAWWIALPLLPAGRARWTGLLLAMVSPPTLLWASLGMPHSLALGTASIGFAALARMDTNHSMGEPARGWEALAALALMAAAASSYAVWPVGVAIAAIRLRTGARAVLPLVPAASVAGMWSIFALQQREWLRDRAGRAAGHITTLLGTWVDGALAIVAVPRAHLGGVAQGWMPMLALLATLAAVGLVVAGYVAREPARKSPGEKVLTRLSVHVLVGGSIALLVCEPVLGLFRDKLVPMMAAPALWLVALGFARTPKKLGVPILLGLLVALVMQSGALVIAAPQRPDPGGFVHRPLAMRCPAPPIRPHLAFSPDGSKRRPALPGAR